MLAAHAGHHAVLTLVQAVTDASVTPPATLPADAATTLPASSSSAPPQDPPMLAEGKCNVGMDGDSTYGRYLWVVRCAPSCLSSAIGGVLMQAMLWSCCAQRGCARLSTAEAHKSGRYLIDQGLYVALDYHSSLGTESLDSVAVCAQSLAVAVTAAVLLAVSLWCALYILWLQQTHLCPGAMHAQMLP